jgi:methylated-DNA-protein-cysteine methyltransferase-like protein
MISEIYDKIYKTIQKVPPGKVATYGQIARICNCGPRLVGYALRALKNNNLINVPWHRVINSKGEISVKGEGYFVQETLLKKEGIFFNENGKIDLKRFGWQGTYEIQI